ncbi:Trichohyalin-plectin-homology domain-containing protein [Plasmodiophora brassicae]
MALKSDENEKRFKEIFGLVHRRKRRERRANALREHKLEWAAEYRDLQLTVRRLETDIGRMCQLAGVEAMEVGEADLGDIDIPCPVEYLTNMIDNEWKRFQQDHDDTATCLASETSSSTRSTGTEQSIPGLAALQAEFESKRDQIGLDYKRRRDHGIQQHNEWCQSHGIDPKSKTGGWNVDQHHRFERLHRAYFRKEGRRRDRLLQRVRLELGLAMSDDDVRLHVEWYERTRAASAWRRDLKADQQRDLAHLTAWFDSESAKVNEQWAEELQRAEQRRQCQKRCDELHGRLAEVRVGWEQRRRAEEEQRRRAEADAAQKCEEQNAQWRERQRVNHELVEQYHREKAAQAAAEAELVKALEEEQRAIRRMMQEVNHERVEYRDRCLQERREQRRRMVEAAIVDLQARERRLEAIRSQVRIEVERDPVRMMQATVASEVRQAATNAPGTFPPVFGYSDEELMKDTRFAVAVALSEAGLYSTPYANRLMNAAAFYRS